MTDYFHHAEQLLGLSSKTVIVTGGANGIGAETVRCCAAHGAKVVIADLPSSARAAEVLISSLSKHQVVFLPVNICSWDETRELFEQTIQKFGQVDIVAANAGIMESKNFFDFETDEDGELKEPIASYRVLDVNIKGIMNGLSDAFAPEVMGFA
jgi:NAD(P)-dependent dehydrogenase (short-subunit alcohol dehydrogenase family)